MTVLVTGGAGFVGLNVVEALLEHGNHVVLFDAGELPDGAQQALEPNRDRLAIERGSVLDPKTLHELFRKHRIERVIHAAAITSGPEREAWEPAGIVDVNVRGTIEVLEAARKHGVQRTIYVGSGAAYGESLYRLPRLYEETPSVPSTLYSITKHAAERACLRLKALWGIDVVCVRLGTVIGPWERDTGARDNFGTHSQLAGMAAAGKTAILTEREIQRDWIYARDVAAGLVALVGAPVLRHAVYNLSSGITWEAPIARWCERLREAYPAFSFKVATRGEQANIWYTDRDRGIMDIGRVSHDIGFRVRYPMQRAYDDFLDRLRKKNPDSKAGGNRGG
jgi:nucleoside-diphosphate-sugar epimerase